MKTILLSIVIFFPLSIFSQDVITKQNGEKIKCKITKTDSSTIYYNIFLTGRMRDASISKIEIKSIDYETKETKPIELKHATISDYKVEDLIDKDVLIQLKSEKIILGKFVGRYSGYIRIFEDKAGLTDINDDEIADIVTGDARIDYLQFEYMRLSDKYNSLANARSWLLFPGVAVGLVGGALYFVTPMDPQHQLATSTFLLIELSYIVAAGLITSGVIVGITAGIAHKHRDEAKKRLDEVSFNIKPFINPYNNSYGLAFNIRF